MILDTLSHIDGYCEVHRRLRDAAAFLKRADLVSLPDGRIDLDGDLLYATVMRVPGRAPEEAKLESHRRYIDIQVLLDGVERIGWRTVNAALHEVAPFDVERDIVFYTEAAGTLLTLQAGMFAVFFPQDAHAPMISDGGLHKIVVKVAAQ